MRLSDDLIIATSRGLYCPAGDFHIDPWRPVDRAIITHAHSDHARTGNRHYLASEAGAGVLRARLGDIDLQTLPYGETLRIGAVDLSFHPAGHVLGASQVRIAHRGNVWVASGDYKVAPDPTCAPFEPVRCDTFITESTFGLPIYRWDSPDRVFAGVNAWWAENAAAGRPSVVFCYAFGKAQRLLASVDASIGPIVCHGAVENLNKVYRDCGVVLPPTQRVQPPDAGSPRNASTSDWSRALVVAPPSAAGTPWLRRFNKHGAYRDAFASGWMRLRGARRRRGVDHGFVLSDHADWPGLLQAIDATGASRVIVTHGHTAPLVRWLTEHGYEAGNFETAYTGDEGEDGTESQLATANITGNDAAPPEGAAPSIGTMHR
ncbi:RNA procession exonuclease-like protein [Robbsia andropogonis]|uniref:RNA procession exonuclease-like protein n=1 Tax=Robbsia andropogonis TaxID=28092 RepID=A0A0F5JXV6_9BURK|nr:ligase-associated DNA damage response exonuclease [Robbsia andropogonis]KKB62515.1 RNA procession exonuclease-like protein [Robbsia andropogonis]MCP1116976.1 ligase-associated DNA damage response exonuclease [Robbsia andropogonis]MCP1126345.1 ligase-associated DNA damage response exonuclease [Robbsia andropogonis]